MRKFQFVLIMREAGFSDESIADVLDLRERERQTGVIRRWLDYLPLYLQENEEKNRAP